MKLDYDKRETLKNANVILNNAREVRLLAESQNFIGSPRLSHSPKQKGNINPEMVANQAIKRAEAEDELEAISFAMNSLDDELSSILTKKYLNKVKVPDVDLYLSKNIAASTFYKLVEKATLNFALCYRGGELVVWCI